MDVLRKELNAIYNRQNLSNEILPQNIVEQNLSKVACIAEVTGKCCVVTDISKDKSYFFSGCSANLIGLTAAEKSINEITSSDEDFLYERMDRKDLVDLRMLEYDFFCLLDSVDPFDKPHYKAVGLIYMRGPSSDEIVIEKTTQVLALAPNGNIWLVLCCYDLAQQPKPRIGINPMIVNNKTGKVRLCVNFLERRENILTPREKEILLLIRNGLLSKEIAAILGVSIHTVNRHRQNILEKLSVDNSMEAVNAATEMLLL